MSLDGLLKQLRVLKSVVVDWWWGIVEGYGRHEYTNPRNSLPLHALNSHSVCRFYNHLGMVSL
ncbi:hypothetical protein C1H46_017127 [Malus baccata]|uniref:Beta-amylase n=1 Tax=Malus baccata TaxID=106549 RepID=A0A540MEW9_MALBA|nr:hypothetical protein C1H46_017127 [Malus baccata]